MNTPKLDRFLMHHRRTCTFWIFSGDRRCSCGRDDALAELESIKNELTKPVQVEMPLFAKQIKVEA